MEKKTFITACWLERTLMSKGHFINFQRYQKHVLGQQWYLISGATDVVKLSADLSCVFDCG